MSALYPSVNPMVLIFDSFLDHVCYVLSLVYATFCFGLGHEIVLLIIRHWFQWTPRLLLVSTPHIAFAVLILLRLRQINRLNYDLLEKHVSWDLELIYVRLIHGNCHHFFFSAVNETMLKLISCIV